MLHHNSYRSSGSNRLKAEILFFFASFTVTAHLNQINKNEFIVRIL